ncbi:hypothetical protein ILUMI_10630 [Ignelater luminosus]|uniref:Uncharacterized protein n=1 Tax=Ignelater luminosus TaxID=2038154 RepID=A0A8K0GES0_IGNLU|nr:hypothetical protein ILUMI_10630 [Ignelater luminosus]
MCYDLDSTGLRILSYQYAKELKLIIPPTWEKEKKATEDWLKGFKQRYKAVLSLRKLEKTSLSRATAFNTTTVNNFFDNLEQVMGKNIFTADRVYNCDETGVTTVSDPPRVFAKKGLKQVGQATLEEVRQREVKKKSVSRKIMLESFSESIESEEPITQDTDDSAEFLREILTNEESDDIFENIENILIQRDDFVLVNCSTKKNKLANIGLVVDVLKDKDCKVKFLSRFGNLIKFIYPDNEEICDVEYSNILRKLPKPYQNAATTRT